MNKPKSKHGTGDNFDENKPTISYKKQWEENGFVRCPGCNELKSKEEEGQVLVYCDNCGYDF